MRQHKITLCSAEHLANLQKNQMSLSNGIMRLTTRISKFSCCLFSAKIVCIKVLATEAIMSSRVVCFLQSAFTSVAATLSKRLLFEIYVVVDYLISFKPEQFL